MNRLDTWIAIAKQIQVEKKENMGELYGLDDSYVHVSEVFYRTHLLDKPGIEHEYKQGYPDIHVTCYIDKVKVLACFKAKQRMADRDMIA
jgi:hypothetical protein